MPSFFRENRNGLITMRFLWREMPVDGRVLVQAGCPTGCPPLWPILGHLLWQGQAPTSDRQRSNATQRDTMNANPERFTWTSLLPAYCQRHERVAIQDHSAVRRTAA